MKIVLDILIVDDNLSDILLFQESLETAQSSLAEKDIHVDINLDVAHNGEEALIKLYDKKYVMIYLDIKMNRMDGIECLTELRSTENINKDSYVIMFTTSDYDEDIIKSHKLKADAYLLKSLDIIEFEENLKNIIYLFIQDNMIYINHIQNKYRNILNN